MRNHLPRLLAWLAAAWVAGSSLHAQSLPQLENDVRNIFSLQPASAWPPPVPGLDADPRVATPNQWRSGTVFGGWQTTRILGSGGEVLAGAVSNAPGETALVYPGFQPLDGNGNPIVGEGVALQSSALARPLIGREPTIFFGELIPRPNVDENGLPVDQTFTYLPEPADSSTGQFYYSPHARGVFATQPGVVSVTWRFRDPARIPQTLTVQYVVSSAPAPGREAKRIFWTEKGFTGPVVAVPSGPVAAVNVRYNAQFPSTVPTEFPTPYLVPGDPNVTLPPEKRTFWYSTTDRAFHAYNVEGRVFVEFLGALDNTTGLRQYLGNEVVEVIREVSPAKVDVFVGDRILPQGGDTTLVGRVVNGVSGAAPFVHMQGVPSKNEVQYYSIRTTTPTVPAGEATGEVVFFWMRQGALDLLWPRFYNTYIATWPTNIDLYTTYVRQNSADGDAETTGITLDAENNSALVFQDDPAGLQGRIVNGNLFYTSLTITDPEGRTLIRHTNGERVWFERVYSKLDTTFPGYGALEDVEVGQRIEAPAGHEGLIGYIRQKTGTAFDRTAYIDPFVSGIAAARNGAIIPVNARPGADVLEVWWYKRNAPPAGSGLKAAYYPVSVQNYAISWPAAPDKILLASNAGSGELPSVQANGAIYYENDSAKPGFNPNDEHALMLAGRAYALRDDLGTEQTSPPYVLVRYTEADGRPAMRVFKVEREDIENGITFQYDVEAGRVLQAPMPLPLLPVVYQADKSPANQEVQPQKEDAPANTNAPQHYSRFTYADRKGSTWIYRGPHVESGESPLFEMTYFYPSQTGFFLPGVPLAQQPAAGTPMPYLRALKDDGLYAGAISGLQAEPLAIGFRVRWPDDAPVLQLGETLTLPTRGLPAVRSQTSVQVLYEQAIAKSTAGKGSVTLFDPTVAKTRSLQAASLTRLPASIFTNDYRGKTYFPNLPPHLVNRFYFDPNIGAKGSLVLIGEFKDEALGDDYLQLNVLGAKDITDLQDLVGATDSDRTNWRAAVAALAVDRRVLVEEAEKRGSFVEASAYSAADTAKLWTFIKGKDWTAAGAKDLTAPALRTGATVAPGADVNVAMHWIAEHFGDLKDWKAKQIAAGNAPAELKSLQSRFASHFRPVEPRRPSGLAVSLKPSLMATYNAAYVTYQRGLKVHEGAANWILSTSREWSGGGQNLTEADLQAVDFPSVIETAAEKTKAWKFVAAARQSLERWDAGNIAPTALAAIEAGLRKDFEATQQSASGTFGAGAFVKALAVDMPVDSYALAAAGEGEGWVTLMAGNSTVLSPEEEPVSLQILRVTKPLGRGELKVIQPSNPLSEKLTLQHSFDFAGNPADFDFEWRTLPPVDGSAPTLYTFTSQTVVGDSTWSTTARSGAASTVGLPGQVIVNTGNNDNGIAKLSRTFPLTTLPFRAFLSIDLGNRDGARVLVNGVEVARKRVAGAADTGTVTPPLQSFTPLSFVYEVPVSVLKTGPALNTIELSPETTLDVGGGSTFNARLEVMNETDNSASWISVAALPHETTGQVAGSVMGRNAYVVEGNSLFTLTDNYFICRFRARSSTHAAYAASGGWSKWTDAQLAEGWIKRALSGINPFEQRIKDLYNNDVNTDVSLVMQAGKRWEGDIALNLENINNFGLIEIYETILRRGKGLSIEGAPPINYGPANDALLLAAGYLNDLYMLLGNEAYADAANPTIAFSTDGGEFGDVATSLFAFKGQLATVLDEELSLLRGRDDFLAPGTRVTPVFNRLVWNYTRGIDSGEAIYALNYNVKDLDGDGVVGAADAAKAFPQGHGDALGHYLTALTGYYGLLWNGNFDWTPRSESVLVLGKAVAVDYLDERKFAAAGAAWAKSVAQTVDLTYRAAYNPAAEQTATWTHLTDGRVNTRTGQRRAWGVDDWAVRGGQGAFFHWLTANSALPATDPDPTHEGIQKIDRTTVPELAILVSQNDAIQRALDTADARLNPLGLSGGAVPFDISPAAVDEGQTHFEQVYSRAVDTLSNAVSAFNNAKSSTQFLRSQEDSLAAARDAISGQEDAYTAQLVDYFGTPYPDDIGPGKTYAQGYEGPDLLHFLYVDKVELFEDFTANGGGSNGATEYEFPIDRSFNDGDPTRPTYNGTKHKVFLSPAGHFIKPGAWTGQRRHPGTIQTAISDLLTARINLRHTLKDCAESKDEMQRLIDVYQSALNAHNSSIGRQETDLALISGLKAGIFLLETLISANDGLDRVLSDDFKAVVEAFPKVLGLANDATSAGRAAVLKVGTIASFLFTYGSFAADVSARAIAQGIEAREALTAIELERIAWTAENKQLIYDLRAAFQELAGTARGVDEARRAYDQADRNLRTVSAEASRLLDEREGFRKSAAALIQGYRTKDLGFRVFRDEALESYKSLFDLAARYTYLAAKAYDYETGLVDATGSRTANTFLQKIASARSLGIVSDGVPQPAGSTGGDPGLSGALARMNSDWAVVKSRFGFNNPDRYQSTFSLRREKERIVTGADGDATWKDFLASSKLSNLLDDPDVRRYCLNPNSAGSLSVPGFVIEFDTTIATGYNFFGRPLAGGDSTFSPTSFATKIRSSGIAFPGYVGMEAPTSIDGSLSGSGASSPSDPVSAFNDPNALSATPYIYLIPAGVDSMRAPSSTDSNLVRSWRIEDQAIPLPFDIGGAFSGSSVITAGSSLSEPFTIRKHQAFRAVPDGSVFDSEGAFTNSRLIGRSVWNSRWKLVIPGHTLLSNPVNGMKTFEETVKDILIRFETYSYSGN